MLFIYKNFIICFDPYYNFILANKQYLSQKVSLPYCYIAKNICLLGKKNIRYMIDIRWIYNRYTVDIFSTVYQLYIYIVYQHNTIPNNNYLMAQQNQNEQIYDTLIIGAGPGGMTAGIYAARREMNALIVGQEIGGQVMWASEIENYPGFRSINNYDLINRMREQVTELGTPIKNEEVKRIKKEEDDNFTVYTSRNTFRARTVIAALGLAPKRLAIPGEEEFAGKGISYCANCDGPFYKGKDVAVVGGGNSALDAAEYLSKVANKVYLVHRREEFKAFESLEKEVKDRDNIELVLNSEVKEIQGNDSVEKIQVHNSKEDHTSELSVQGVFIEIGRIARTDLVKDLAERDEGSQIKINDKCETSTPGLYAIGDVTTIPFKQITVACGHGTIAALAAYQFLNS